MIRYMGLGFYRRILRMTITGDRIKALRKQRGYRTQQDFGRALGGIDQTQVSRYERGEMPKMDMLIKIADALQCSIDYLIGRSDIPESAVSQLSSDEQAMIVAIREHGVTGQDIQMALAKLEMSKRRKVGRNR